MNGFKFSADRLKGLFAALISALLCFNCTACSGGRGETVDMRDSRENELAGVTAPDMSDGEDNTDYDEYDLVILRYYSAAPTDDVADALKDELGWKIKIVTYGLDEHYKLNTKLMARDDDFDLYIDASADFSKYMLNGFYTDLKQFDSLIGKMSSNRLVDFAADYNGEYIGLPMTLKYNDSLIFENSSPAVLDYCAKNLDTLEKRFSDPDGEKLFEVLRYAYDNGGDVKEDPREYIDFSFVESSYCIMSPKSRHKDAAALFLERMYDAIENTPETPVSGPYPDIGDADLSNAYLTWKFMNEARSPIVDAYLATLESDGEDGTLKKLAKEAAAEVAMMVGE